MSASIKTGLTAQEASLPENSFFRKLPIPLAIIGVIGLGATFALSSDTEATLYSYLVAYMFFLTISLGAGFFIAIQFLARVGWSVAVRRLFESLLTPLPILALLFAPILLGADKLYKWTDRSLLDVDPVLVAKAGYLNMPFWTIRAIAYLLIFSALAFVIIRLSTKQDKTGDHDITRKLQRLSPPTIALLSLSSTFAAFDWIMSLDYHWYSTIFGIYIFSGAFVAALCLVTIFALSFRSQGILKDTITAEHYHDLGKLIFGFMVFWTYIAFSQYFLIWYANMPETTGWFMKRTHTEWMSWTKLLAFGHFVIPFAFLMPRTIKRKPALLFIGAVWLFLMHYVDLYWLIIPHNPDAPASLSVTAITSVLGVGGIYLAVVFWFLNKNPLVPIGDPRLPESLNFENF